MSDHTYVVNPFTPRLYAKKIYIFPRGRYDNKADSEKDCKHKNIRRGLRRHRY